MEFRPDAPEFLADPYPVYRRLREEDPVHWSPRLKAWVLTRYDDVRQVLLDREISSDRMRPFFATLPGPEAARIADIVRYLSTWMVFRDPPEHTRLRRLTGRVFHVQSMHAMRPVVEELATWLLERIGGREEIDFIADFAGPLPALVIMAMLGVPREQLAMVKRLSDDMALFIGSSRMSPEKYDIAEKATREMAAFFRELIQDRRGSARKDLLSELVHLRDGDDALSEDELIATCILLLFAGHETTTNHIANGLLALLRFPGEMAALRADPDLAARAVEELLRYDGPVQRTTRIPSAEVTIAGRTIGKGEMVMPFIGAADRDPAQFADPDRLDLARTDNRHIAFGWGIHFCLGAPLARVEGQIAIDTLVRRFPKLELVTNEPEYRQSLTLRGLKTLPVRF